ncbi:P-loop containing nucleoside triphosphate hydrolase protein [Aspergillus sclerotiicarbonarius CBS 121057]|uniref:DNA repair protein RAD51 homolog 3 n=1 Tax=Aspergillus sclerotiicarbonarius (strain CBS 121057 / IBT 28362) TaxID=1448318 RepID=A0A319FLT2_ASPSB|nr:P-loop containing nucleoside triphosphate hydrolase protein [Aspergillus sclerotiicarbonarius CBS 121057]
MNRLDILGLSTQDHHRVISFPASQSLHASTAFPASGRNALPIGLAALDEAISPASTDALSELDEGEIKGLPLGHVTEVFGPPGAGKTALALNAATGALRNGNGVVWIDTASPLPKPRLQRLLSGQSQPPSSSSSSKSPTENLTYIRAPTLPHLLSLLHHPPPSFPPPNTTLLVIDSISAPFAPYFPNPSDANHPQQSQKENQKWLTARKWNVISDLATQLVKFASKGNLAVLVVNQMHTRIRGLVRATLSPVLSGRGWEACVYVRVGVYGDFGDGGGERVRVAEVMKRAGRVVSVRDGSVVVPFRVGEDGLYAVDNGVEGNLGAVPVVVQAQEEHLQEESVEEPQVREEEEKPVHEEELIQEEPVRNEPVQEKDPVQEELVQEEPVQEEPVQEEPVQEEPEEPVQEEPVQEEPVQEGQGQEHAKETQAPEAQEQVQLQSDTGTSSQRKRKAEEIADSQDEDESEGDF